jgi:hypothetical protein
MISILPVGPIRLHHQRKGNDVGYGDGEKDGGRRVRPGGLDAHLAGTRAWDTHLMNNKHEHSA